MPSNKPKNTLLYSTNTELAYRIAKEYYNREFYVWCTDSFDAPLQPGTSNPRTLCQRYLDQIIKQDRHAHEIENNKAGILKGAKVKLSCGIITEDQYKEISAKVTFARLEDFYPMIFLINKRAVRGRITIVEPGDAASDNSVEYIVSDLQWNEFEVIRVKDILLGVVPAIDD